jgi:hypothetical protein
MKQVKNFFYPSRGILGVFAVWAALVLILLFFMPPFNTIRQNPSLLLQDIVVNLIIMYLLSCLSTWIYEKMKKE